MALEETIFALGFALHIEGKVGEQTPELPSGPRLQ
jgi:hypothetical protein